MNKLSLSALAISDTLATLEAQAEVFLREAEAYRRASQRWTPPGAPGGRSLVSEDREAGRAWALLNQAVQAAASRAHARVNGKPVPSAPVDLASVFKGK